MALLTLTRGTGPHNKLVTSNYTPVCEPVGELYLLGQVRGYKWTDELISIISSQQIKTLLEATTQLVNHLQTRYTGVVFVSFTGFGI